MKISVKLKQAEPIAISTGSIKLDSFLKFCGAAETGGQAKLIIAEGAVKVNGAVSFQRGKSLVPGDKVAFGGGYWQVVAQ
ncbi:MAG: RNA-binding S4 domain-containing protein [Clostridium sp.]|nr:RNA-binding S4 domain-containing protein [Clostridium sp.]